MLYGDLEGAMEATVTAAQAKREIEKHGLDPRDFFREIGRRETYSGADVLGWLGY